MPDSVEAGKKLIINLLIIISLSTENRKQKTENGIMRPFCSDHGAGGGATI
jgi:hypothetical protein